MQTTRLATADHFGGDDYTLRVLIERMQRIGSSEREIDLAVRKASGCLAHPASPRRTARRRPSFPFIGRRLLARGQLRKRAEDQR